ncbi:hypothetical protein NUG13_12485 [Bacillus subtilis]|uniref:Uncharacterized protein n=2 Tax=Zhangjivirus TaxID=3044867 RepID=A0AAE9G9S7_9CAUD|nr:MULTISPECIES: hypothetical protein [Bacillus subtilis group]YP_010681846.1 hypothetical protein PQE76_gp228 [Bacillus phage vB_BsuS_PJN02]YP_010740133.1 hypothetical protein P9294_gp116 [Bacillus phage FADO]MCR4362148.1 hypothetical protein [Bacillus subtilis]UNH58571.1 hypothetical protein [Bacillus phage vB_BsuS_PJN02]UNY48831.1 hypothetical protein fado_116 [Bacillus phage FADO]UQB84251.1 hypothetical protein KMZ31_20270 [Bacillus amyloliquefaciens]WOF32875.1 hypothetical protein OEJ84
MNKEAMKAKFTKMVYDIHVDELIKRTEKAYLVGIEDRTYWIPRSCSILGKSTRKSGRVIYNLLLPTWYKGDILAKDFNGEYINNVGISNLEEELKNAKK